ncbi:hypothetical protein Tco_0595073 [Tanacetum coccineum]
MTQKNVKYKWEEKEKEAFQLLRYYNDAEGEGDSLRITTTEVMTINSNPPPQIHEVRVEALKKENGKDENLHGMDKEFETCLDRTLCIRSRIAPMARHGSRHLHLCQQVRYVFKDEERLSEAIRLTGKLNPKNIGPFKNLAKVGIIAYKLELLQQLSKVHSTLHLKECWSNETLVIPLDEIQIDDKLYFIEETVKIIDRDVRRLNQSRIPTVKVRWNSKRGPESTWEREDQLQKKYLHLFAKTVYAPNITS